MAELPNKLRPYAFHGIDVVWQPGSPQAVATCPMCDRAGKFSLTAETGQCHCWVCGWKGNAHNFLRWLHEASDQATTDYASLTAERGLLYPETPMYWGLARSVLTGDWLLPGYGPEGNLNQLYKYVATAERKLLMPTPGLGHQLFGMPQYDKDKSWIYLCEGPWDGLALWEVLGHCKWADKGLVPTSNLSSSLLANSNVLAVPTCSVFADSWVPLFRGKSVVLLYDNDHPATNPKTGAQSPPAGYEGMRRVAGLIGEVAHTINYLCWGQGGYDPDRPSGYDVRDLLTKGGR